MTAPGTSAIISKARLELAASGLQLALDRMNEGRIDQAKVLVADALGLLHKFVGEQPHVHDMVGA